MKITFRPADEDVANTVEPPMLAKLAIPEWYKNSPNFNYKNPTFDGNQVIDVPMKMCMPFLDGLSAGYIQKTWTDIFIRKDGDQVTYRLAYGPQMMHYREKVSPTIDDSYYQIEWVWRKVWTAQLPKGYSALITHPLNRLDLPFTTMSAVVDADTFFHTSAGNIPFFIKKDFEGRIPAGTPMYQIIPIKRESWESEAQEYNEKEMLKRRALWGRHFWGAYKDHFRQPKNYS